MQRSRPARLRWLRVRLLTATATSAISLGACGTPPVVDDLLGNDRAPHTPACLVVAPALMPADEVDADVALVVHHVADDHGRLVVIVARGPSASAFVQVRFDTAANGGSFASKARSAGRRDTDAARWRDAGVDEIRNALAANTAEDLGGVSSTVDDGLDLLGGLTVCARLLPAGTAPRTIAVVSHGVHRTTTLDLAADTSAATAAVVERLDAVAPGPAQLVLLGLGRVDARTNDGAAARSVTEPITRAWTDACVALGPRCSTRLS